MTMPVPELRLHPDRSLPPSRGLGRSRGGCMRPCATCPSCPHGHVDPRLLVDNEPFADPAILLVTPDHYMTRPLHASGVPLDALGGRQRPPPGGRRTQLVAAVTPVVKE